MTKSQRYASYKRGWLDGTRGEGPLVALGTPVPPSEDDYKKGFEDGHTAFNEAMHKKFDLLDKESA